MERYKISLLLLFIIFIVLSSQRNSNTDHRLETSVVGLVSAGHSRLTWTSSTPAVETFFFFLFLAMIEIHSFGGEGRDDSANVAVETKTFTFIKQHSLVSHLFAVGANASSHLFVHFFIPFTHQLVCLSGR